MNASHASLLHISVVSVVSMMKTTTSVADAIKDVPAPPQFPLQTSMSLLMNLIKPSATKKKSQPTLNVLSMSLLTPQFPWLKTLLLALSRSVGSHLPQDQQRGSGGAPELIDQLDQLEKRLEAEEEETKEGQETEVGEITGEKEAEKI